MNCEHCKGKQAGQLGSYDKTLTSIWSYNKICPKKLLYNRENALARKLAEQVCSKNEKMKS